MQDPNEADGTTRRQTLAGVGGVLGTLAIGSGTATVGAQETQRYGGSWPLLLENMYDNSPVRSTETLEVVGEVRNRSDHTISATSFLLVSHPNWDAVLVDRDGERFPAGETVEVTKHFQTAEVRNDSEISHVSLLVAPVYGQRMDIPVHGTG